MLSIEIVAFCCRNEELAEYEAKVQEIKLWLTWHPLVFGPEFALDSQ